MEEQKLRNQMFEETRAQRQLEIQETLATGEQIIADLESKYVDEATCRIKKHYQMILGTIGNTMDRLRKIQVLTTGDLTDDVKRDSEFYLVEIFKSTEYFKIQATSFENILISDTNAHQEVVQLCRDSLRTFETLIVSQDFVKLCVQLPYAVKSNNECAGEIKMLGECAGRSFTEFDNARIEIKNKLDAIESQKPDETH